MKGLRFCKATAPIPLAQSTINGETDLNIRILKAGLLESFRTYPSKRSDKAFARFLLYTCKSLRFVSVKGANFDES